MRHRLAGYAEFLTKICLVLLAVALSYLALSVSHPESAPPPAPPIATSTVKLIIGPSHGSGVHIGDGYVVTAAHVLSPANGKPEDIKLKRSDGAVGKVTEILWTNTRFDIALLRISGASRVDRAHLACRDILPGEPIEARGNPANVDFVSMRGHVAGTPREHGPWGLVAPSDITIIGGMSGGGIFDDRGLLVGIAVGGLLASISPMFPPNITGVTLIVPSSAVCDLLARERQEV